MTRQSDTSGNHSSHFAPLPRISIQVFCETTEVAEAIQAGANDRRMEKTHVRIQTGGVAGAVEAYRHAPTPNVIIVENTHPRAELLAGLEELAEFCDAGTKVLIIGHLNDVLLYRELVRRGVSEYLIAPFQPVELVRTLSELFRSPGAEPVGRTVAFVGAKGGVGSSTVCHNVAWAVSRFLDTNTVLVDMDLPFGTAGLDLNQDPAQGIAELAFSPDRVDAALVDRLMTKCTDKLSLLAAPATLDRTADFDADSFDTLIDVLRANVPALMLDVPHVWSSWTKRVLSSADEIVLVATPDLASLRNAKNILDLLRPQRRDDSPPRLFLNMVDMPKRPEIKVSEFARELDTEAVGIVPFDAAMFGAAANNGQMIAEIDGKARAAEMFLQTAALIMGKVEVRRERRRFLDPLLTKLQRKRA